jgi:hypothetical protein
MLCTVLVASAVVFAGGGAENLLLVVNADSADSLAVANEYIHLRKIPPSNVVYLNGLPPAPTIKIEDFRQRIIKPVLETVSLRELAGQIDYVVYSAGFPYAVDVREDMVGKTFPVFITQPASLTGLTYLHELVLAKNSDYLSLDANWYVRRPKTPQADTPWSEADRRQQAELYQLFAKCEEARKKVASEKTPPDVQRWLEDAATISRALVTNHPNNSELLYNLACVLSLQQKPEEAMSALTAAYKAGWWNAQLTEADTDLASLREREDFKALVKKMREVIIETSKPQAFRSTTVWGRSGEPSRAPEGRRYFLSAMLAYTGGKANTLAESLNCLRQSVAADGICPKGTIYYMVSKDWARTGPRQWAFRSATDALNKLGVRAEVLDGVLPKDKPDVAGAMIGAASFDWKSSGSQILPGAFCDHLTSFGGVMAGSGGQSLLSEFLRYGAGGACGTVTEPYNVPGKFPTAFLHIFYASGCSLAEAFFQSVSGPYQQLLVGDPLCQPWAKIPVVRVKGLSAGETVTQPRSLIPTAESVQLVTRFELFVDGRRRQSCAPGYHLTLDPTGLAEGYHEARVVAVAGSLETRGRVVIPFRVGKRTIVVEGAPTQPLLVDQTIRLTAKMPGAQRIAFLHNEREMSAIAGDSGTAEIKLSSLGVGTVVVQPVAYLPDGKEVRGAPLTMSVAESLVSPHPTPMR